MEVVIKRTHVLLQYSAVVYANGIHTYAALALEF